MQTVGVRELRQRASEILRRLEESGEEVQVTRHGRTIARLVPVPSEAMRARAREVWADMDRLAAELDEIWPHDVSAVDAVREQRREL